MDCLICNTRSAIESCVVCHKLLCEVCGVKCEMCGGTVCPEHVYTTHSGKTLCHPCQEKRRAARHARHAGKKPEGQGADLEADGAEAPAEEEELERPVLVASVRKPPPPWKMSLYIACAAGVLALAVLVFPGLRGFTTPWWGSYFPTPYLLLVAPVVSVLWGLMGMVTGENQQDRYCCLIGIGVALAACVLLFVAVFTDPVRVAAVEEARTQGAREKMTPAELKQWREQKLQKFNSRP